MNKKKNFYTVYLRKTDEIVVSGTAVECAAKMNKSVNCFHSLVSKNRKGKQKKYVVVVEADDLEESDIE